MFQFARLAEAEERERLLLSRKTIAIGQRCNKGLRKSKPKQAKAKGGVPFQ